MKKFISKSEKDFEVSYEEIMRARLSDTLARIFVSEEKISSILRKKKRTENWFDLWRHEKKKLDALKVKKESLKVSLGNKKYIFIKTQKGVRA